MKQKITQLNKTYNIKTIEFRVICNNGGLKNKIKKKDFTKKIFISFGLKKYHKNKIKNKSSSPYIEPRRSAFE